MISSVCLTWPPSLITLKTAHRIGVGSELSKATFTNRITVITPNVSITLTVLRQYFSRCHIDMWPHAMSRVLVEIALGSKNQIFFGRQSQMILWSESSFVYLRDLMEVAHFHRSLLFGRCYICHSSSHWDEYQSLRLSNTDSNISRASPTSTGVS